MTAAAEEPLLLRVEGMFCTSCAKAVEKSLGRLGGVRSARVGFATSVASLVLEPGTDRPAALAEALERSRRLGYPAEPWTAEPVGVERVDAGPSVDAVRLALGIFLGMWTMAAQVAIYFAPDLDGQGGRMLAGLSAVFATPVVFVVGARFHLAAWRTLRARAPGMDVLVSLGTLGAWTLSMTQLVRGRSEVWMDAAAMLVVLLLAGRLLERGARHRGVDAVRRLLDLSPPTALRVTSHGTEEVPASAVEVGEQIEVPAGARVPLDGVIVTGQSSLQRAALTGESLPVEVGPGELVEAGCENGDGVLVLEVSAGVGQRALDAVARQVREALDQRAEERGLAERISEKMVPLVLAASSLTWVVSLAMGLGGVESIARALSVLVVTCPCALGIAAPLVEVVAIGRAAKIGILVRAPDALRRAAEARVVVFDKTGTLTRGQPELRAVEPEPGVDPEQLLAWAAGAELGSEHPLGRALRAAGPTPDRDGARTVVAGRGVEWVRGEELIRVGAPRWLAPDRPSSPGTIWVERNGRLAGRMSFSDTLRPEVPALLDGLRAEGYGLRLASGDGAEAVAQVAARVGLTMDGPAPEAEGELSPLDKAERIRALEAGGCRVAFVGDGINDAPGLAAATVGFAVVGASDAAKAAAGIVARSGELTQVARTLRLARRARRRVATNLAWAVGYNVLAVPAAALGLIGPGGAALAMALSSLSVTLNAVRPGYLRG